MAVTPALQSGLRRSRLRQASRFDTYACQLSGARRAQRSRGDICDMIRSAEKLSHISEDGIRQLVDAFYVKVRLDPELAPIFARAIPGDWQPHLTKMYAFWSSVMLTSGLYKGNPVVKHLVIPGIRPHLFERWLALFDETCGELFDERISEQFRAKAERIAESLKLALFYRPDRPWPLDPTK
jgi:hemoglobin